MAMFLSHSKSEHPLGDSAGQLPSMCFSGWAVSQISGNFHLVPPPPQPMAVTREERELWGGMPALKCFGPEMTIVISAFLSLATINHNAPPYCKTAAKSSLPGCPGRRWEPNTKSPDIFYCKVWRSIHVCIYSVGVKSMGFEAKCSSAIYLAGWPQASYFFHALVSLSVKWRYNSIPISKDWNPHNQPLRQACYYTVSLVRWPKCPFTFFALNSPLRFLILTLYFITYLVFLFFF